jgi:hypothetical protein
MKKKVLVDADELKAIEEFGDAAVQLVEAVRRNLGKKAKRRIIKRLGLEEDDP